MGKGILSKHSRAQRGADKEICQMARRAGETNRAITIKFMVG